MEIKENPAEYKKYDIAIIGAGPAGIMAAISAASAPASVPGKGRLSICILERNHSAAKKLLLTGNGRCNYTANIDMAGMLSAFGKKGRFFSEAFKDFSNRDLIAFFESAGIEPEYEKTDEDGAIIKVFPKNRNAAFIRNCLIEKLQENNIHVIYGFRAIEVLKIQNSNETGEKYFFEIQQCSDCGSPRLFAHKVILATGGMTYPHTGSTGDGYAIAKNMGHSVNELVPHLVPVFSKDRDIALLAGVSVKDVGLKILSGSKVMAKSAGSILFTHKGLSGPCALSIGHEVFKFLNNKYKKDPGTNSGSLFEETGPGNDYGRSFIQNNISHSHYDFLVASLDLAPDLTFEGFRKEITNLYKSNPKKELITILNMILKDVPQRLLDLVLNRCKITGNFKIGNISKAALTRIYNTFKSLEFIIENTLHLKEAIVTEGGIPVKEINPKDLQSVLTFGLYFAGEIIELAGPEGGFNLQKAFSTGWLAGKSAAESLALRESKTKGAK